MASLNFIYANPVGSADDVESGRYGAAVIPAMAKSATTARMLVRTIASFCGYVSAWDLRPALYLISSHIDKIRPGK
jgi:hypothetical protein